MATAKLTAVRTAAAWIANQTAMEALYGIDNYYTTLTSALAALPASLVIAGEQWTIDCYNDWPSGLPESKLSLTNSADSTRYVVIQTLLNERHGGIQNSGFWLYISTAWGSTINFTSQYLVLDGVEIDHSASSGDGYYKFGNNQVIKNNILSATGSSTSRLIRHTAQGSKFYKNLVIGNASKTTGIWSENYYKNNIFYNNVITGFSGEGLEEDNAASAQNIYINNVAYNNGTDFGGTGTYNASSSNNASGDSTASTLSIGTVTGVVSGDFESATDFHLAIGSSLIGEGLNLYSDFQTDIDGDTWPSSGAWDIGADYYVAAGGSTVEASFTSSSSSSYIGQLKHNSIFDSVSDSISAYNGTLKQYGLFNSDSVSGSSYNSRVIQSGLFSSAVSSGNSYTGQIKQYGLLNSVAVSSVTFNGSLSNNLTGAFASAASSTAVYNGQLVHSGLFNSVSSSSASFNGSLNGVFTGEFSSYSVSAASYQGNLKQYGLYSSGSTSSILFNGKTVFYGSFDSVSSSSASFTGSLDSSKHGLFNSVSLSSFAATSKQVLYSVFNSSSSSLVTFVPESAHTTAPAKRTINVNQSNRVITSSTNNRTITVN